MNPRTQVWLSRVQDGFVLWVLLGAGWGWLWPEVAGPGKAWIAEALALIMLGMGLSIPRSSIVALRHAGWVVAAGCGLQFLVMPLAALAVAAALRLPPELAVGLVLVGAAPGGTASNVVAFLARGNVALSVAMTTASTLLCPLVMPLWVGLLAATWIPVDPLALLVSLLKIVLLPVAVGILVRRLWTPSAVWTHGVLPLVSMGTIAWIVGVITALNRERLDVVPTVAAAVVLVNAIGLTVGYAAARKMRLSPADRRTVSLEVGMQNSGLAVALALAHFSPLAAIPGALFSIWHNVTGPILASIWRRRSSPADGVIHPADGVNMRPPNAR